MKLNKYRLLIVVFTVLFVAGCLVAFAYIRTWGKTEIEFKIHINEELILQSVYGETPTFAIWIENPETDEAKTIFVTKRAGLNDWEGKVSVPSALPKWDNVSKNEQQIRKVGAGIDAVSGATPLPGYFVTRVRVKPGSKWNCWIEMNLAGDYNQHYKEFDEIEKKTDEFGDGQPAIVYKTYIEAAMGNIVAPEVVGMSILNEKGEIIQPLEGITTALEVFDEITIAIVKPKPRII